MYRCGTSGYGLVGMVVLGGWLDSILEVFSNLWFYLHPQLPQCWSETNSFVFAPSRASRKKETLHSCNQS